MKTGLCTDERFRAHAPPRSHPESPARLEAIDQALDRTGLRSRTVAVAPRPATRAELALVHAPEYLEALEEKISGRSGWLDPDTYFSTESWAVALDAAGAAVELAERILSGALECGAAFVRPPGHHATRDRAMGFCLLNNVAVAARVLERKGARVAIFDWDVHHGNGTEAIFADDPDVLYASTHEWPQYPGTGPAEFTGIGRGLGATVNVPLPAGTDGAQYLAAYRSWIEPALERFRPDVILVSAGFDAHRDDPLGGLALDEETWVEVTRRLLQVQPRLCLVLEGGYHLGALGRSAARVVETLCEAPVAERQERP